MAKISVKDTKVTIIQNHDADYISLTDIARFKTTETNAVICNWLRNRNTIEYLGIWETLYNPDFKPLEFEGFKKINVSSVILCVVNCIANGDVIPSKTSFTSPF